MSSIWTPSGEHEPEPQSLGGPQGGYDEAEIAAIRQARRELGSVPAAVMVHQHAWGIAEVAMLHLMPEPQEDGEPTRPRPEQARVAIDALAAIIEAVGEHLPEVEELREAVAQLQMGYVELSQALAAFDAQTQGQGPGPDQPPAEG
ncbi:MAG: hypothetical protein U0W40_08030 [Acidimicrobiia bacterium]